MLNKRLLIISIDTSVCNVIYMFPLLSNFLFKQNGIKITFELFLIDDFIKLQSNALTSTMLEYTVPPLVVASIP